MYLYLLQSKKDRSFYIGVTKNLKERLKQHNKGLSPATKHKRPWVLIYVEWYRSGKDAIQREKQLKKHKSGWNKLRERISNSVLPGQN